MLNGKCECQAVLYRVLDGIYAENCHCSNCRAGTGSAFKPFAGIGREKLEIVAGADTLLIWGDDTENHTRCGICGSLLFSVVRGGGYVHVAMGSLVDAQTIRRTDASSSSWKAPSLVRRRTPAIRRVRRLGRRIVAGRRDRVERPFPSPFSSLTPRASKPMPEPATRFLTVPETQPRGLRLGRDARADRNRQA